MPFAESLPATQSDYAEKRHEFLREFFEEADAEQALLDRFAKDCIGKKKSGRG